MLEETAMMIRRHMYVNKNKVNSEETFNKQTTGHISNYSTVKTIVGFPTVQFDVESSFAEESVLLFGDDLTSAVPHVHNETFYCKCGDKHFNKLNAAKVEFKFMVAQGIFTPSKSPWASPLHMVHKKSC